MFVYLYISFWQDTVHPRGDIGSSLSVCLSPTGHNFKLIFTKLHHMVELVIRKKAIVFEVNMDQKVNIGQRSTTKVVFLKSPIFIRLTWNLKRSYFSGQWIEPANYFWGLKLKRPAEASISKIDNFHPIDLKFEDDSHFRSMNSTSQFFLRST